MEPSMLSQLLELQVLRGNTIIVYNSTINSDSVRMLYECMRRIGPTQQLDLVLSTSGGIITVARRLALLLREFTEHLNILVPYQARSAGTLLCLSANELVLGPMAELGPIDAHISSATAPPPDGPLTISAEDIRVFRQMAEDWFGVNREKDRLQVLALVAQRIFPTSLSSFYRSDRLTRLAAHELLHYQLPDAEDSVRQRIVDQLVSGYDAHDHIITRADAQSLGLRVRFTSAAEEELLWSLSKTRRRQLLERPSPSDEKETIGLIMSAQFCACQAQRWDDSLGSQQQKVPRLSWEIEGE